MTNCMPLFEAKAHLSDLVRRVAESGQSVLLTVRGKPMVRIVPAGDYAMTQDAWEVREKVVEEYGVPDFVAGPRMVEPLYDPFADEAGQVSTSKTDVVLDGVPPKKANAKTGARYS